MPAEGVTSECGAKSPRIRNRPPPEAPPGPVFPECEFRVCHRMPRSAHLAILCPEKRGFPGTVGLEVLLPSQKWGRRERFTPIFAPTVPQNGTAGAPTQPQQPRSAKLSSAERGGPSPEPPAAPPGDNFLSTAVAPGLPSDQCLRSYPSQAQGSPLAELPAWLEITSFSHKALRPPTALIGLVRAVCEYQLFVKSPFRHLWPASSQNPKFALAGDPLHNHLQKG